MGESEQRSPEPGVEQNTELVTMERELAVPSLPDNGDLSDDAFDPARVVSQLREMADDPEKYEAHDILSAIARSERLLADMKLKAQIQAPASLPKLVWILGIFMPELRKQIATYLRRKQESRDTVQQAGATALALKPLVKRLRRPTSAEEFDSQKTKIELSFEIRALVDGKKIIDKILTDPIFVFPRMITHVGTQATKVDELTDSVANVKDRVSSRLDLDEDNDYYSYPLHGSERIISRLVSNLNEQLNKANEHVQFTSLDTYPVRAHYDDRNYRMYKYRDISSLVVDIKVKALKYKEFLKTKRDAVKKL